MKKLLAIISVCLLALSITLLVFNINSSDKMTIKVAKLTKSEEAIVQLLNTNTYDIPIYHLNYDGDVKYVQFRAYTLDKEGKWICRGASGGVLSGFFGAENKKDALIALIDITSEGGNISWKSGSIQFIFPKVSEIKSSDNNISWSKSATLEQAKIISEEEIPLLIYVEDSGEISRYFTIGHFFDTKELIDLDSVNAITITFSKSPL